MPRGYETFAGVKVVAATDKALLVDFPDDEEQLWVPRSQIGPDSDVVEKDDEGDLDVTRWWAEQAGLR